MRARTLFSNTMTESASLVRRYIQLVPFVEQVVEPLLRTWQLRTEPVPWCACT